MRTLTQACQIIRHQGIGNCAFRLYYEFNKKQSGFKDKFPSHTWSKLKLQDWLRPEINADTTNFLQFHKKQKVQFFFDPDNLPRPQHQSRGKIIAQAREILANKFRYFFLHTYSLGTGPNWFVNPVTGKSASASVHWRDINFFDDDVGDIKFIWEPSRFAWAFTLVRAFAATGDNHYAEKFWQLFESWCTANPPNMGPNYACGQECAIRVLAMCFALYGFARATATRPDRVSRLLLAIAIHADRIEKNIKFAISTQTNHALTEAAGLFTIGLLFPEFRRAEHWRSFGEKILISQGLKQIYSDGAYIQHSMNYHRLLLQVFLWVVKLAKLNGRDFPHELLSRLHKATLFLFSMQDKRTGQAPNYGANDGALILPLNDCDFRDYRPVLQAMYFLLHHKRLYERGPWDEDLLWLFGPAALESPMEKNIEPRNQFSRGGYYILRNRDNRAMIRCHTYRHRPTHADMLHMDLWWRGINVLCDSGSYMYHCKKPWQHYFLSTAAHNTVEVDHKDQMTKGPRFMWYDWTKSSIPATGAKENSGNLIFSGSHCGYKRLGDIVHHRSIESLFNGQVWLVIDDIVGSGRHTARLFWHLVDAPVQIHDSRVDIKTHAGPVRIQVLSPTSTDFMCCRGDENIPAGFRSLYYGEYTAIPCIIARKIQELPIRFVTLITLGYRMDKCTLQNNTLSFLSPAKKRIDIELM